MIFGLSTDDITQILTAVTALVVAVEAVYTKFTHRDVKKLKNGELKIKVKEALDEREEEKDSGNV